jgi:hypothetical protein
MKMINNIQSYTKEQCVELATEFVNSNDLLCTAIFRGNIFEKGPESWEEFNKKEKNEKITRLANLIYYELAEKNITLAFFRANATSYNKGLSVQYYGDGAVQLLRKCAKKEEMPEIVGGIKYSFIFRDILGIIKNQKKWIEESCSAKGFENFYYISTSMIYNINFIRLFNVSDDELMARAVANAKYVKKNAENAEKAEPTQEEIQFQYNELHYARKIAVSICSSIENNIPEILLIKKAQDWNDASALVAGVGKYKIITRSGAIFDQESMWNVDITKTSLKIPKKDKSGFTYTPYYHYPMSMAQTKIEKECYASLYGRSLIALTDYDKDEARYEEAANSREAALNTAAAARNLSTRGTTDEI